MSSAGNELFLRKIHAFNPQVISRGFQKGKAPDKVNAIQLIVQKQLTEEVNLWLKSLTNDLKERQETERLLRVYKKHERERLYRAAMNVIVRANGERLMVSDMCEALDEILEYHFKGKLEAGWREGLEKGLAEGLEKGLAEGREQGLEQGLEKGLAQKLLMQVEKKVAKGKTLAQIADELEETEEDILPLYNKVREELGIA